MKWSEFLVLFEKIDRGEIKESPYDNPEKIAVVRLNMRRISRWLKKDNLLLPETIAAINSIKQKQTWHLIIEPWCGDGAHVAPVVAKMAAESPFIEFNIVLRDGPNNMIDDYLTNGAKAMPILVVRDCNQNDLFHWGPRPKGCLNLVNAQKLSDLSSEEKKIEQQKWFNADEGVEIQQEIAKQILEFNSMEIPC